MPILQVRDLPEEIYQDLSMMAAKEKRSLAQQTVVLLQERLGLKTSNKSRRKALLSSLKQKSYPKTAKIDTISMVRADRNR